MSDRITRRRMLEQCAEMAGGFAIANRTFHAGASHPPPTSDAGTMQAIGATPPCLEGTRIRWIVGWTPGGGFDTYSRLAEPFMEKALGAEVMIDNVPGAGGLVGALTISRARPDGRTLGILNGSGLLWDRNPGAETNPDLTRDFTVLARVSQRQQVILANAGAGLKTLDDLIALSRRRAIVAGVTAPNSSNFASLAAISDLLGLSTEYVPGYPGSREVFLGLLRGDCDITCVDIESFLDVPDLEGANPLLQITPERSPDPRIAEVPHLAGPSGLVATRPELFPGDPTRTRSLSAAIAAYLEFGRLFAGPAGMAPALRDCVEEGIHAALTDPGFAAAARRAGRSIDVATGAELRRDIPAILEAVRPMKAVTAAAARGIR